MTQLQKKTNKSGRLLPVDKKGVPLSWHSIILSLEASHELSLIIHEKTGHIIPQDLAIMQQLFGIHWAIKIKWNSKHKMPRMLKEEKDASFPIGQIYVSTIRILEDLCDPKFPLGKFYDIQRWFDRLLKEGQLAGEKLEATSKPQLTSQLQSQHAALTNHEDRFGKPTNPFKENETPYTWYFIKCVLSMIDSDDTEVINKISDFKTEWKNLLQARVQLINKYKTAIWAPVKSQSGTLVTSLSDTRGQSLISVEKYFQSKRK